MECISELQLALLDEIEVMSREQIMSKIDIGRSTV